jgi:HlyD family secretion protein
LSKLEQESAKVGYRGKLLELRAPQDGIVKDVATTTAGSVVQPGMVLLTLVPDGENLLAEVHVRNEDVGFVSVDQSVMLKVAAYPFQRYGLLQGKVLILAPDAQSAAAGSGVPTPANYKAVVRLEKQYLDAAGYGRQKLESGMQVVAEINQGSRSVVEYLLSPVQRVVLEAGRER